MRGRIRGDRWWRVRASVLLAVVTVSVASPAGATPGQSGGGTSSGSTDGHGVVVGIDAPGTHGGSGGRWRCTYRRAGAFAVMPWGPPLTHGQLVVGVTYVRRCVNLATGTTSTTTVTARPPTPPTTQRAEKQAPTPDIGLSPDPAVGTVLGIPTWMWVRNFAETDPIVLENGSVGVLARLVPRYVIWDLGDDGPTPDDADVVRCDGPGVPWTPAAAATAPVDAVCTYSFRHRGTHHVTATIWWDVPFYDTVSHQISYLPPVSSTSSVDLAAHELDTVIRDR